MVLTAIAAAVLLSSASALGAVRAAEGEASNSAKGFLHGEANFAGLRLKSSASAAELEAVIVTEARVSLPFSAKQMKTGVLRGGGGARSTPEFPPKSSLYDWPASQLHQRAAEPPARFSAASNSGLAQSGVRFSASAFRGPTKRPATISASSTGSGTDSPGAASALLS